MEPSTIMLIVAIASALVTAFSIGMYVFIREFIHIHFQMAVFADIPMSIHNNNVYLNIVNVKRYNELWNAHEDELEFYAFGTQIKGTFFKSKDIPNGYKLACLTHDLTAIEILSLKEGGKYNAFEISIKGLETRWKVNSVKERLTMKIKKQLENVDAYSADSLSNVVVENIKASGKKEYWDDIHGSHAISHVNEGKTTGTTMRFQTILPSDHVLFTMGFEPEKADFFYVYEGHCYEIESKFVENVEHLYEWDLINLKPGTIYTGLSFSIDGGKTTSPSVAMYGVTKNKHGELPTIDDAKLAKPDNPDVGQFPMWNEESAVNYLGESLAAKNYDIIVKKHYEDEYTEEYLGLSRASEFHQEYDWLKHGKANMQVSQDGKVQATGHKTHQDEQPTNIIEETEQ